jgi:hypothetical protein
MKSIWKWILLVFLIVYVTPGKTATQRNSSCRKIVEGGQENKGREPLSELCGELCGALHRVPLGKWSAEGAGTAMINVESLLDGKAARISVPKLDDEGTRIRDPYFVSIDFASGKIKETRLPKKFVEDHEAIVSGVEWPKYILVQTRSNQNGQLWLRAYNKETKRVLQLTDSHRSYGPPDARGVWRSDANELRYLDPNTGTIESHRFDQFIDKMIYQGTDLIIHFREQPALTVVIDLNKLARGDGFKPVRIPVSSYQFLAVNSKSGVFLAWTSSRPGIAKIALFHLDRPTKPIWSVESMSFVDQKFEFSPEGRLFKIDSEEPKSSGSLVKETLVLAFDPKVDHAPRVLLQNSKQETFIGFGATDSSFVATIGTNLSFQIRSIETKTGKVRALDPLKFATPGISPDLRSDLKPIGPGNIGYSRQNGALVDFRDASIIQLEGGGAENYRSI